MPSHRKQRDENPDVDVNTNKDVIIQHLSAKDIVLFPENAKVAASCVKLGKNLVCTFDLEAEDESSEETDETDNDEGSS